MPPLPCRTASSGRCSLCDDPRSLQHASSGRCRSTPVSVRGECLGADGVGDVRETQSREHDRRTRDSCTCRDPQSENSSAVFLFHLPRDFQSQSDSQSKCVHDDGCFRFMHHRTDQPSATQTTHLHRSSGGGWQGSGRGDGQRWFPWRVRCSGAPQSVPLPRQHHQSCWFGCLRGTDEDSRAALGADDL